MKQMVLTLSPEVDENLLIKILENIKGIWKITLEETDNSENSHTEQTEAWLRNLREIRDSIDLKAIDMDDEKTKYLLAK